MTSSLLSLNTPAMATSLLLRSPPFLNPNPNPNPKLPRFPRTLSSPLLAVIPRPPLKPSASLSLLDLSPRRGMRFVIRAGKDGGGEVPEAAASAAAAAASEEARGRSTMPERFRYLTKEAPDRPVRWPWFIALAFLLYAWRTVLWELANWKKAALSILNFIGYLLKLALAFIFRFIGDPITGAIRCVEFTLYVLRNIYADIVAFAPVPELTRIIFFSSTVLAIAEATVPHSMSSQSYLLTMAGIISFGVVKGFVPELPFGLLLAGFLCYARFIKKADWVSAALPSVAALAAVGEPWVRVLAIGSYLALAIVQHSKSLEGSVTKEPPVDGSRIPMPLLLIALAIGIHVAAKWVRLRHLTWMIA